MDLVPNGQSLIIEIECLVCLSECPPHFAGAVKDRGLAAAVVVRLGERQCLVQVFERLGAIAGPVVVVPECI